MPRGSPDLVATWNLLRFDAGSGSLAAPLRGTELTATFQGDGRLAGSAGCNRYGTTYEAIGSSLTVDPRIAATRMWCGDPEGAMAQEDAFLLAWGRVASYDNHKDRLEIADAKGATVFVFVLAQSPNRDAD